MAAYVVIPFFTQQKGNKNKLSTRHNRNGEVKTNLLLLISGECRNWIINITNNIANPRQRMRRRIIIATIQI